MASPAHGTLVAGLRDGVDFNELESRLSSLNGVSGVEVSRINHKLRVEHDGAEATLAGIRRALEGFTRLPLK